MKTVSYTGMFDGSVVSLDEPAELPPNTRVLVTVLPESNAALEKQAWYKAAAETLDKAFGSDEPDYSLSRLKHHNPEYEGR
jgi:hypothetical protein